MILTPKRSVHSGRLGPGQMLVVDLVNHKVYEDEALLELFDAGTTYATLVEDTPLAPIATSEVDPAALAVAQRGFGYTREDVKMILQPMATGGQGCSVVDG